MGQTIAERIDALRSKEASLIDEAGAPDFSGKLEDVRVQLDGVRDQRKFLEEQQAAAADDAAAAPRVQQAKPEDIEPRCQPWVWSWMMLRLRRRKNWTAGWVKTGSIPTCVSG